jgi:alpha-beta hydrolase superfamily lysophospholipase
MLPIGRRIAGFEGWRLGPRGKSPLVQSLLFGEPNKSFKPVRTPFDWLSRDAAEVDKYISDPLCGFEVTTQLAIDLVGRLAASPRWKRRRTFRRPCRFTSSAAPAIPSAPSCEA